MPAAGKSKIHNLASMHFRKYKSKTLKETSRKFYSFIFYFDWLKGYIILEKTEDSVSFKTNHSVITKQGLTFRDFHTFHIIFPSKKKSRRRIAKIKVIYIFVVKYKQN